jgi:hypothetical protein
VSRDGRIGERTVRQQPLLHRRLDAALSGHPLLPAWTFWSQLDTARRHAETDGRRVDLYRLAAFLHGLPLRLGAADEQTRHVRRLLTRVAVGEPPYSESMSNEAPGKTN